MARPRRAIVGWVLFDWACQPFFTLVTTFVFAPYFAAALAPDPVSGQALWGYATAAAGLTLAVLSPVLGSIADASGPRKPWIALCGAVLVVASASLWFAAPGAPHGIVLALVAFAVATVAVEVAAVFNNAMMVQLVPPERLGRLSGAGWATGYAGGLVSLVVVLGFLAASPETGTTYLRPDAAVRPRPGAARRRPHHRPLLGRVVRRLRPAAVPVHARHGAERPAARGGDAARPDAARRDRG